MTITKPRVLHLVDSLGLGGVQTILKEYFAARPTDPDVFLYALRTVPREIAVEHPNLRTHGSSTRFSLAPLSDLRRIVDDENIMVLHCHLFRAQVFGYLLKCLYFPTIKLVFHEHGRAVGREGESGVEALLFRAFLRIASGRVDRFICISEITRTRLLALAPGAEHKATVVANPIPFYPGRDHLLDRKALRKLRGVPQDAFVVGFASRLVERKGWSDFLGAMALLAPGLPIHFLLAGDGEDRARAQARILELGLQDRGTMLGHIDWMPDFFTILDCFVMPSHWEPHGLAHLEAQSFRLPVVVSRVPGLSSTVHADVDALVFDAGDPRGLADCVHRLAVDLALRERLVVGGVANAKRYSRENFDASIAGVYATLAGN